MSEGDGLREALVASLGSGYRVDDELTSGGLSRAFAARDERLGRDVVIKVLSPALGRGLSMERFGREIKLAAILRDPHIAAVYAAGATADGLPFYVTAAIRGDSLRAKLGGERMPTADVVGVLRDVARALAHAHRQGVVHRDLKPELILLSYGSAVVADFGIAKAIAAARARTSGGEWLPGSSIRTPAYMSPEQAAGGEVDARSDLYAWGVIAYELLSGAHPFPGTRAGDQYIESHLHEVPVHLMLKLPNAPVALCELVMRCLEKDPARRPIAATELVRVLDDAEQMNAPVIAEREKLLAAPRFSYVTRIGFTAIAAALAFAAPSMLSTYRASRGLLAKAEFARDGIPLSTVAVLPFSNGGDASGDFLVAGVSSELAHALAQVPGVRIAGWTSSHAFKDKTLNVLEIGKALGVGSVVTGSAQRIGGRLRLSVNLVSANDGTVLWTDRFERPATAFFTVQDEVTRRIISAVAPKSTDAVAATAGATSRGTSDAAAYELLLRGQFYLEKRGADNVASAIDYFHQAAVRDPRSARAQASLALAYAEFPGDAGMSLDSVSALALTSATRALVLDPNSAVAHFAMALALRPALHYVEAEQHFTRALRGLPGDPKLHQHHAENLAALGRMPEAFEEMQAVMEVDPASTAVRQSLMGIDVAMRRFDDALTEAHRIATRDSSLVVPRIMSAFVLASTGRADSAIQALDGLARPQAGLPGVRGTRVFAYAVARRWSDATRVREEIVNSRPRSDYDVMLSAIVFGDAKKALDVLEQSDKHASDIASLTWSIPCSPVFDPLKVEPRFATYLDAHRMSACPASAAWPVAPRARRAAPTTTSTPDANH